MTYEKVYTLTLRLTVHRSLSCYIRLRHEIRYARINTSRDTAVFLLTVIESKDDVNDTFL
jgi:hypothetical protein